MDIIRFRLTGTAPLAMHNVRLANPLDPVTKKIKVITSKRKKTDDDHAEIFRLEWEGGLYHDPQLGPYVPGQNIDACIKEGARLQKRGKDVERAMQTVEDRIPVQYKGPRGLKDIEELYPAYSYIVPVVVVGRTMRCRPIFPEWALEFSVAFSPDVLNPGDIEHFLNQAGRFIGLCEGRPRYGKFTAELLGNGNGKT